MWKRLDHNVYLEDFKGGIELVLNLVPLSTMHSLLPVIGALAYGYQGIRVQRLKGAFV